MENLSYKKRVMKKNNTTLIVVALSIFIFLTSIVILAGWFIKNANEFWGATSRIHVYSEVQIVEQVADFVRIRIPKKATNLYFAHDEGIDIHCRIALTLSNREECKKFLDTQFMAPINDFKKVLELPETYIQFGTESGWPIELKGNWDISKYKEYYIYDDSNRRRLEIVYVPEHSRIFIFKDYPD
ncbi:MAG: hypothetical protein FVQ79_01465 [Planctomycetes bacterium]|nr:hypothetical protein [Planctomycetota bacterium]